MPTEPSEKHVFLHGPTATDATREDIPPAGVAVDPEGWIVTLDRHEIRFANDGKSAKVIQK